MEKINNSLEKLVKIPSFQKRYQKVKEEILSHPRIKEFIEAHKDELTQEIIDRSLTTFQECISQSVGCCKASNTKCCKNLQNGFYPNLVFVNNNVTIQYVQCEQYLLEKQQLETSKLLQSFSISPQILEANISQIDYDSEERIAIGKYMAKIKQHYKENKELPKKGLYLHGIFGSGKSYILGAIANEFVKMRVHTFFVYVPELIIDLKNSIRTNEFEEKMDNLKKIPILIMDDLGAEVNTEWSRDEVLGTIINYRMMHELPLFVSSNLNYEELEKYYSYVSKTVVDPFKGARISQRIQALTIPIGIEGKNNRKRT